MNLVGKYPRIWTMALVALVAAVVALMAAPAAKADTGTVEVTGTVAADFAMTLTGGAQSFGDTLSPRGAASGTGVSPYTDSGLGAYYVKGGGASSYAQTVQVESNKAWSGSIAASENTQGAGVSDMTIGGGSLRWSLGDMGSLSEAKTGGSAFTTTANNTVFDAASSCSSGATKQAGICTYNFDYALRVLYTNSPGTFGSTVTYTATQAA